MSEINQPVVSYAALTITPLPNSTVEIKAEVPLDLVLVYRQKALKNMIKKLSLPGFRTGHVPIEIAEKHIGEQTLMEETAERVIARVYADIVTEHSLDVIGRPSVTVTKLAPGNPIGFTIVSAVYPTCVLPDYRVLAEAEMKKHKDPEHVEVSEDEMVKELERLRDMFTEMTKQSSENNDEKNDNNVGVEINDDFARSLGEFADLADLKQKLQGKLHAEKKSKAFEARRLAIVDRIITETELTVPELFVEGELEQMVTGFHERVARAGLEMSAYLASIAKTLDDLRKEWRPDAEKRAKLQVVLSEIAKRENITPPEERVSREVSHVLEHYPDATEDAVRSYVVSQITNELVFAMLENRESGTKTVTESNK